MADTKKTKKPRKKNFVNNGDLLAETIKSQEEGEMTDKLAAMLVKMCQRYTSSSKGHFINYSYLEDMRSYALVNLVTAWAKFKPKKSSNAFAFYTQCIHNSYLQFLKQEKKQRNIRDELLLDQGLNPSHTFIEDYQRKKEAEETENIEGSDDIQDTPIEEPLLEF